MGSREGLQWNIHCKVRYPKTKSLEEELVIENLKNYKAPGVESEFSQTGGNKLYKEIN